MSMPFYVSPEQLMKDRADFARKGIARGRSVVAVQYADGILFVSENPSQALHKVTEIYDRIAFAAVGRYNEFENLRIAGVRLADMRGYSYDRRDVTGRGLANAYAQTLGTIFSSGGEKPYEVEIFVAEVGDTAEDDQIYRLTYDGQVADEHGYAVMGGAAETVAGLPRGALRARGSPLDEALAARRRRARALRRAGDRVIPDDRPRGRGARPHPHASRASSAGCGPSELARAARRPRRRRRRTSPTPRTPRRRRRPRRRRPTTRPTRPTRSAAHAAAGEPAHRRARRSHRRPGGPADRPASDRPGPRRATPPRPARPNAGR